MSEPLSPKALISYAHEDASHDSLVRTLADQLRHDGVECDLDQYHDVPQQGWPSWIADKIFDDKRFVLVIASPGYLCRWLLAEREGIGLGAKYEGRLIRQVLYSEEGLNGRVIPVIMEPNDKRHIPPELRDTTKYNVLPNPSDVGYDALLRRLTEQPALTVPTVVDSVKLLDKQTASLASVFYVLQQVPAPFPIEILCQTTGMTRRSLLTAAEGELGPPILNRHDGDLLTTTYYRPVPPLPSSTGELLGWALDALLACIEQRGSHATTHDEIRNALVLAGANGVRPDLVARVFEITHKAIKRLGDKRLVWRAATLSLEAARRGNRHTQDAKAEAIALICGQSWVLQRVNKLEQAEASALDSLALGKKLKWHRNTAFCLKCLGRLSRMRAVATDDSAARQALLTKSEQYLRDSIDKFTGLDDHDREEEVGECQSLLGRTLLVAKRLEDARAAALKAESQLNGSAGKEYQDLQILHGDLAAASDPRLAEDFYSDVIRQCATDDAPYSEIRARAFYSRARSRLAQGYRTQAKRDFEAAAKVWRNLQDPAVSVAEWGALTCNKQLSIDPTLLESRSQGAAVRVRAIRNHEQRLQRLRGRAARRGAPMDDSYINRLVDEARTQVAIEEIDWVSRIIGKGDV